MTTSNHRKDSDKFYRTVLILSQVVEDLKSTDSTLLSGTIIEIQALIEHHKHLIRMDNLHGN